MEMALLGVKPVGAHFLGLSHGQVGWELRPFSGLWEGFALPHPGTRGLWQSGPGLFRP